MKNDFKAIAAEAALKSGNFIKNSLGRISTISYALDLCYVARGVFSER